MWQSPAAKVALDDLESACPGSRHIALSLWTDGGLAFKGQRRSKSLWPLIARDMNIPADQRNKHLMLLALCEGAPSDMDTFLSPIFGELQVAKKGWRTPRGCHVNAGVSIFSGDGPALSAVLGCQGHSALFGCYRCYTESRSVQFGSGHYFAHNPDCQLHMRSPVECENDCRFQLPFRGTANRPRLTDVILGGDPYKAAIHDGAHAIKNFGVLLFGLITGGTVPQKPKPRTPPKPQQYPPPDPKDKKALKDAKIRAAEHVEKARTIARDNESRVAQWKEDCQAHTRWILSREAQSIAKARWRNTGAPKEIIDPKNSPYDFYKTYIISDWMKHIARGRHPE